MGRLVLAAADRAERAEEDLAGIGGEDQPERDDPGDEGADVDLHVAEQAGDAAEQHLPAVIDDEQRQQLRAGRGRAW